MDRCNNKGIKLANISLLIYRDACDVMQPHSRYIRLNNNNTNALHASKTALFKSLLLLIVGPICEVRVLSVQITILLIIQRTIFRCVRLLFLQWLVSQQTIGEPCETVALVRVLFGVSHASVRAHTVLYLMGICFKCWLRSTNKKRKRNPHRSEYVHNIPNLISKQ